MKNVYANSNNGQWYGSETSGTVKEMALDCSETGSLNQYPAQVFTTSLLAVAAQTAGAHQEIQEWEFEFRLHQEGDSGGWD